MLKKIVLSGIVQGVFCRQYCSQYAKTMKLRGSATNLSDGNVKLILDLPDESTLEKFISSLRFNPKGYRFYGNITGIDISNYEGRIVGDYNF